MDLYVTKILTAFLLVVKTKEGYCTNHFSVPIVDRPRAYLLIIFYNSTLVITYFELGTNLLIERVAISHMARK